MIRADILQQFPGLFGKKTVNGRELDVDETITLLSREIDPAIAEALAARRAILAAAGAGGREVRLAGLGRELRGSRSRASPGRTGRSCRGSSTTSSAARPRGAGG